MSNIWKHGTNDASREPAMAVTRHKSVVAMASQATLASLGGTTRGCGILCKVNKTLACHGLEGLAWSISRRSQASQPSASDLPNIAATGVIRPRIRAPLLELAESRDCSGFWGLTEPPADSIMTCGSSQLGSLVTNVHPRRVRGARFRLREVTSCWGGISRQSFATTSI